MRDDIDLDVYKKRLDQRLAVITEGREAIDPVELDQVRRRPLQATPQLTVKPVEGITFCFAWPWQGHRKRRSNAVWVGIHDEDAVRQGDGLGQIVRDEDNGRISPFKGRLCDQDCTKTISNALNDPAILIPYCFLSWLAGIVQLPKALSPPKRPTHSRRSLQPTVT